MRWNNVNLSVESPCLCQDDRTWYSAVWSLGTPVPRDLAWKPQHAQRRDNAQGTRFISLLLPWGWQKAGHTAWGTENCRRDSSPPAAPGPRMTRCTRNTQAGESEEGGGEWGGKSLPSSQYGLGFRSLRFLPFGKLMCFSGVKCSWVLKCVQHLSDIWESKFAEQRWALIPVWMLIWPQ